MLTAKQYERIEMAWNSIERAMNECQEDGQSLFESDRQMYNRIFEIRKQLTHILEPDPA